MSSFLRGLFDRLFLVAAVVAGGLVPGFIAQYRQRLGGRLDQAQIDLAAWQSIADRFYQGNIDKLIQYHLHSTDATFHSEGNLIELLLATVQRLQGAVAALHADLWHQLGYLALHADAGLVRVTFADWVPTFALSVDGLLFAAAFALAVWLLFHASWWLIALIGGCLFRSRPARRPRRQASAQ